MAKKNKKNEININVRLITICVFLICDDRLYEIICKIGEEIEMENTGTCLCGVTKYLLKGKPEMTVACHCNDCKKQTSSPFSIVAGFLKENVEFLDRSNLKQFNTIGDSGKEVRRFFCGNCGSPIYSDVDVAPGFYYFKMGTVDDPSWVYPEIEIYTKDKIKCSVMNESVKSFEIMP